MLEFIWNFRILIEWLEQPTTKYCSKKKFRKTGINVISSVRCVLKDFILEVKYY